MLQQEICRNWIIVFEVIIISYTKCMQQDDTKVTETILNRMHRLYIKKRDVTVQMSSKY